MTATRAIMVLGTSSNVGKSWLATGLCALLRRWGFAVAPFKAQNLSNNSAPARTHRGGWGEIGRSQAAQADACGLVPDVDMNPLLIKPEAGGRAQRVLLGEVLDPELRLPTDVLWAEVTAAYGRLAANYDIIVLEGAGSPVELNLLQHDIVNGRMALHAAEQARQAGGDGACLLVGDIDRGGIFAALHGTIALMPPELRALVQGLVVNRFRGDPAHFDPGPALLRERTGVPVRGVIPWRPDIPLDPEDGEDSRDQGSGPLDICVLRLPALSNFEDLVALGRLGPMRVRFVASRERVGSPDLVVLPGTKDTLAALDWLRRRGLDRVVQAAAKRGVPVLGLCGGYQLLGRQVADPKGSGGSPGTAEGLGLLPVDTIFDPRKQVQPAQGQTDGGWLLPAGLQVQGYEIHNGSSTVHGDAFLTLDGAEGCVQGSVAGTYLHGLLDDAAVRNALVDALMQRRGLPAWTEQLPGATAQRQRGFEQLADIVEAHLDLEGLLG